MDLCTSFGDFNIPRISVISKYFDLKRGVPKQDADARLFAFAIRDSSVSDKTLS